MQAHVQQFRYSKRGFSCDDKEKREKQLELKYQQRTRRKLEVQHK